MTYPEGKEVLGLELGRRILHRLFRAQVATQIFVFTGRSQLIAEFRIYSRLRVDRSNAAIDAAICRVVQRVIGALEEGQTVSWVSRGEDLSFTYHHLESLFGAVFCELTEKVLIELDFLVTGTIVIAQLLRLSELTEHREGSPLGLRLHGRRAGVAGFRQSL